MARRGSIPTTIMAASLAAILTTSAARPALATGTTPKRYDGVGAVTGTLALSIPLFPLMFVALASSEKLRANVRAWEITLYVTGLSGLALAGTAFVFEGISEGKCPRDCAYAYSTAGVGAGLSALAIMGAGFATYQRTHPKSRAFATLSPLVLQSIGGPAIGAGIAGVAF